MRLASFQSFLLLIGLGLAIIMGGARAYADDPIVTVDGDISPELSALIYAVIGTTESGSVSAAKAQRRLKAAKPSVAAVMRSQGYYGMRLHTHIVEGVTDHSSDEGAPLIPVITVTSGPQFTYGQINIQYEDGELTHDPKLLRKAEKLNLVTGQPALSAPVVEDELKIIKYLEAHGYPDARPLSRKITVDHDTQTMDITFMISKGQRTRFGETRVSGTAKIRNGWVDMISPIGQGDVFNIRKLNRLNTRVTQTGGFGSSTATLAPPNSAPNPDGTVTRNVLLNIDQGKPNSITAEIGISTTDGSGVDVTYTRRNLLGGGQTLSVNAIAKTNQSSLGIEYNVPYLWHLSRALDINLEIANEDTDAFSGNRITSNGFLTQKVSKHFKLGIGAGLEVSDFKKATDGGSAYLVGAIARASYDSRDNIFDPQKGYFVEAELTPAYNFADDGTSFTTAAIGASAYKHLSDSLILAGRTKLGTILSKNAISVPLNKRFYAGGGGSVRGYGYQTISPTDITGVYSGGRSIVELSGELRYHASKPLGFVAFVDTGAVTQSETPKFNEMRAGAGLGVRYYTSFAPFRLDIAVPLDKRDSDNPLQIYISIGQAF